MKFQDLIQKNILFDSHCHLNDSIYKEDLDEILDRAQDKQVEVVIDMSINQDSVSKSIELSDKYIEVFSAVGFDPEIYIPGSELYDPEFIFSQENFENLISEHSEKIIMIGETGIDKYWIYKDNSISPDQREESIEDQKQLFKNQLEVAEKLDLPVSIHSRDAVDECIDIVSKFNLIPVFHSLTNLTPEALARNSNSLDPEVYFYNQVNKILEISGYVGINGIVTYTSAGLIQNVYKKIYRERARKSDINTLQDFLENLYRVGFVLETDGPYLTPSNVNNKVKGRNEPASVARILQFLYELFI